MSWRTGGGIFIRIWPIIKEEIGDKEERKQFTKDLLELFVKYDVDQYDLEGIDSELNNIIEEM